mmetsp:Transcript_16756/g.56283  ORF Transcript_16756/g.56283 Transcript_16756/m.56283 type:complete len:354 (-) Transcript_16756:292-1353(-)
MPASTCSRALAVAVILAACGSGLGSDQRRARARMSSAAAQPPEPRTELAPFWVSMPLGLALGAAALPLSPLYSAIAMGVTQTPQSRLILSRVGGLFRKGRGVAAAPQEDVTVADFARALNSRLDNIVDDLGNVPAFLVVDANQEPLTIGIGENAASNVTFVYLDVDDARALVAGLRTPAGDAVSDVSVVGTTLDKVVRRYLEGRASNETEMLLMPSSTEARTAAQLIAKLQTQNTMVPNSVPVYHVEGLPPPGTSPGEGPAALSFLRFADMQARLEAFRNETGAAGAAEVPKMKVRIMRLHEVAALSGTDRLPGRPTFVPSSKAVQDLELLRAGAEGGKASAKKPAVGRGASQ